MSLLDAIREGVLVADGAMGTLGAARGLPLSSVPALWPLERPDLVEALHREYVDAGARLLLTATFGATRPWLATHASGSRTQEANRVAVACARRAAAGRAYVAGDVGPTGFSLGAGEEHAFDDAVEVYHEQIAVLVSEGVDAIAIETMYAIEDLRAAVTAANACRGRVPLLACMTFGANERSADGTAPGEMAAALAPLGVEVVGVNCCEGPASALAAVEAFARATPRPILAKPSAGLPVPRSGTLVYPVGDAEMAAWARRLVSVGARIVGGCCGTTPETVRAIAAALDPERAV